MSRNSRRDERELVITNTIPGAAFGRCLIENQDVYIPNRMMTEISVVLDTGDYIGAVVVPSTSGKSCRLEAVRLFELDSEVEEEPAEPEVPLQDRVLSLLEEEPEEYYTVNEIMSCLELDIGHNEVLYACEGLHSVGTICKASVWAPNYTKKGTFLLYAKNLSAFAEE